MNFDWTSEENELRTRVKALFDEKALAEVSALEESDLPGLRDLTAGFLGRLAESGYLSLGLGPGAESETMILLAAQEELARVSGSLFLAAEASARLFGGLIAGWGGPDLAREVLEPLQSGGLIGAVAWSEPADTEPAGGGKTRARLEGEEYVLTGRKSFVTNGPLADWIAVVGAVEDKAAIFLVQPGQEGLSLGPRLRTLGYNGLAVSGLELTQVRVPAGHVLGPFEDEGPLVFLRLVGDLALTLASVGLMHRLVAAAQSHARSHFRGSKPIYAHQEVRFKLADMFTLLETARLLAYRAGWFLASADREAGMLINCAKVFAAEAAEKAASLAMQVLAGQGYVWGNVVERGYREAKFAALAGTTSELVRMAVADELLRRYRV